MRRSAGMPRTCWQGRPCHRDLRTPFFAREGEHRIWITGHRPSAWRGGKASKSDTAQPGGRNQDAAVRPQRHAVAVVVVTLLNTLPRAWSVSSGDQPWRLCVVPRVLRHQECKRRCTRIRRDERGWDAGAATGFGQNQCVPFALSLLIRVNLRFHFFCPRSAHTHQVGEVTPGPETAPSSSRGGHQIAVLAQVVWSGRLRA